MNIYCCSYCELVSKEKEGEWRLKKDLPINEIIKDRIATTCPSCQKKSRQKYDNRDGCD